jgi:hypothetical protein
MVVADDDSDEVRGHVRHGKNLTNKQKCLKKMNEKKKKSTMCIQCIAVVYRVGPGLDQGQLNLNLGPPIEGQSAKYLA